MTDYEKNYLINRLVPVPRNIDFFDGPEYVLREKCPVEVRGPVMDGAGEVVRKSFRDYWSVEPFVTVENETTSSGCSEAYSLSVSAQRILIVADSVAGIRFCMQTLRQMADVLRGSEKTTGYFLVQCEISDAPASAFRGLHLCIFPESDLLDIEKKIRLAAQYKYNYVVLEPWGVFPFESHPGFCFSDRRIEREKFKRIILAARDLGITPIPQFNILGHASMARAGYGKHAVLDANRQFAPLFEPDGWTWCLTNPHTKRILSELAVELHDFFERPEFFHAGCDEAHQLGVCRDCAKRSPHELFREHLTFFHDLFAGRNTRIMIWHDMLVTRGDVRWKGYIACGRPEQGLDGLYREIPRDIILCDWQYNAPPAAGECNLWPTLRFFSENGFECIACPWLEKDGTRSLGELALNLPLRGILATTWDQCNGPDLANILLIAAQAAWNPGVKPEYDAKIFLNTAAHLRCVCRDMKIHDYAHTGFAGSQITH